MLNIHQNYDIIEKKNKVLFQDNVISTIHEVDTLLFATSILTKEMCLIFNTIYPKI